MLKMIQYPSGAFRLVSAIRVSVYPFALPYEGQPMRAFRPGQFLHRVPKTALTSQRVFFSRYLSSSDQVVYGKTMFFF